MRIALEGLSIDRLDLGCGKNKHGVGIDLHDFGQEIVWDLTKGIPLPDNSVKSIYTSHFLEHVSDVDMWQLFNEIIRVCVGGAIMEVKLPHKDSTEAYFVNHVSLWDERKVQAIVLGYLYDEEHLELISTERVGLELRFKIQVIK